MNKDDCNESKSSTQIFLDLLEVPEDDTCEIDLKQAAVFVMAHLDRLASPQIPVVSFNKVSTVSFLARNNFYCMDKVII